MKIQKVELNGVSFMLHFDPLYACKEVKYYREEVYVDNLECKFLFNCTNLRKFHSLSLNCSMLTWYFSNTDVNAPLLLACRLSYNNILFLAVHFKA